MIIAFVHNNKAFLPALNRYTQFFSKHNIQCEVVTKDEIGLVHRHVEWFFMGIDLSKPREGIFKIHEYTSTSVPPFRIWKDLYKSFVNTQPDARIYQNDFVRKSFNLKDHIPFYYREVGVPAEWLQKDDKVQEKEFDFIYVGDLSQKRKPGVLADCFTRGHLREHTLLLLGKDYDSLKNQYHDYPNILFRGPVPPDEVKNYIRRSKFAINYIPDEKPFSHLSSTKFLEYAACGIPVISTDYSWARQFEKQNGGRCLFVSPDLSDMTWEKVNQFNYASPDLTSWTWEKQIRKSGILDLLEVKFPEIKF